MEGLSLPPNAEEPLKRPARLQVDTGIVLRRLKQGDSDLRLTFLFRHLGRVIVTAKGAQRINSRIKAVADLFVESESQIYIAEQSVYARLVTGHLYNSHSNLRLSFPAYEMACRSCEVINMLVPYRAPVPGVYDILQATLEQLPYSISPKLDWATFVIRLFQLLGHGDLTTPMARVLPPEEAAWIKAYVGQEGQKEDLKGWISDSGLNRILGLVHSQLNNLLPHQMKSAQLAS